MSQGPRGLVARVIAAYPDFRAAMARELAAGRDEPQMLAYAIGGSVVLFVAALPRILITPPPEVVALGVDGMFNHFLANLVTFLFFVPLFLYAGAAVAGMIGRAFGGTGGWAETRLATFWSILVAAPVILASSLITHGLTLSGAAGAVAFVGIASGGFSAWIWAACFAEAHGFRRVLAVFGVQAVLVGAMAALLVLLARVGGATS